MLWGLTGFLRTQMASQRERNNVEGQQEEMEELGSRWRKGGGGGGAIAESAVEKAPQRPEMAPLRARARIARTEEAVRTRARFL